MKILAKVELTDQELSPVFDLCGHFKRCESSEEYQKLIPHMREAINYLAQAAFAAGREYERKLSAKE